MEEIRKLTGFPILTLLPEDIRMEEGFPIIELTEVKTEAQAIGDLNA